MMNKGGLQDYIVNGIAISFVVVAFMHSIYADSLVPCSGTFLDNVSDDLGLASVTVYLSFLTYVGDK